jgi:pyridine nucleotide-disulfide oxidoreductase
MPDVAIIGAGPYGLSIAAYFRSQGISFRIFGRPMDSWLDHMPKGMMLKSDGFASNIYDPAQQFTLGRFCAEKGIDYADTGIPVRIDTFNAYGLAFRERMVPELEDQLVLSVERSSNGFVLQLENGETVKVNRVVLATGITHFQYIPETLANLPAELVSHSARHRDLEPFSGRDVVVLGGGSSALDLAGLLHEAGANVRLVSRRESLKFHSQPTGKPRSAWQQVRHPQSGLGPGMRSRFFANAPGAFHYLPEGLRIELVRRTLGPSGGWFIRDKVVGKVPTLLNQNLEKAESRNGNVVLHLRAADGSSSELQTQHVIAATGYRVDLNRLAFLSPDIRSRVNMVGGMPELSSTFESSMPGLYFAGLAAANSFGPVMRFAFGARFAAERLTQTMGKSFARSRETVPTTRAVSIGE